MPRPDPRPTPGGSTHVDLHTPVPAELAPEIESRLLFVSPAIDGFELVTRGGEVHGVTVFSRTPAAREDLSRRVNRMVDSDVRWQRVTRTKTVWTSPHRRRPREGVFAQLAKAGVVSEAGDGQVAIGEPLVSLLACLDRAVTDVLAEDFAAREYRYPTLISTRALQTADYTGSFPQHLMFVTRLHNDVDVYLDFQESYAGTDIDAGVLGSCGNVDYCLPPTMCYHTFHQYRGRALDPDGIHVVTSRGKSFRFEAAYATTLERLWDFTIREIVFLGGRDEVLAARERFMGRVFALLETMGLSGTCEVANDPFFGGEGTAERIGSQRLLELKYELRLPVAPGRTVAVASFNFHGELFGSRFGIARGATGPVSSACAGFGLERLVYAFLCQYGTDPDGWPAPVRATAGAAGTGVAASEASRGSPRPKAGEGRRE